MDGLDDVAREVLRRRYLRQDEDGNVVETPDGMFRRVASSLAAAEARFGGDVDEVERRFYEAMAGLDFLPNSPALMNAGTELGQLAACFVLPIEDTLPAIFDALKHTALIHQSGGGTGFSFSRLRPRGDVVAKTGGVASGPVSFMRIFDAATEQIKQGGRRRGANMGVLSVDHPDVEAFVTAKAEPDAFRNFNLSVATTGTFWDAFEAGEPYELVNPRTDEVVATAEPARILDLVAEMAWGAGDPGLLFVDRIEADNPTPGQGRIEATNPCVTGDTLISTADGLVSAEELCERGAETDVIVDGRFSDERVKRASRVYPTGEREVYRLRTVEGYTLRLTADHRVRTPTGWVKAADLEPGDDVCISSVPGGFGHGGTAAEGRVLGWFVGDGTLDRTDERAILDFYDRDVPLADSFVGDVNEVIRAPIRDRGYVVGSIRSTMPSSGTRESVDRERIRSTRLYELCENHGLVDEKLQVPEQVLRGSRGFARGFLRALFTADGSVQGSPENGLSVRLWSTEVSLLEQVQQLLLNFGIASKVYQDRQPASVTDLPDGNGGTASYETNAGHELVIAKDNVVRFRRTIGFLLERKNAQLREGIESYERGPYTESFTAAVASVEHVGKETVFDLTEPDTNSFVGNGIVVHNCGEVPLLPYEACVLGSVNLGHHTDGDAVDWEKLRETVHLGVRLLDDAIEVSEFPIPEIEEAVARNRKVGLGVMGFHDVLVDLGVPYDSEEAIEFADELMAFVRGEAWEASRTLAEERGPFPTWEESVHEAPVRNATTTSVAPTGTISMIAGCSASVEPIYNVAYTKQVLGGLDIVNDRFVEIARERGFYSESLMEDVHGRTSIQDVDAVPDDVKPLFQTAHDVPAERHVEVQAAFQAHVDNAVSKTVNLPREASVDDVREIFLLARDLGVKGITVFRSGARREQVLGEDPLKEECVSECEYVAEPGE